MRLFKFGTSAVALIVAAAFVWGLVARGVAQTTSPATTQAAGQGGRVQYVGVWSQPKGSLAKWKARGVNVLFASEPENRADGTASVPQAEWRAAARAVPGGGLPYYDRPSTDVAADAADPFLLGFLMDDEVDRRIVLPAINALKTETDLTRRLALTKQIADCVTSYKVLADRCRATGKPVLGNFSGPEITGGFPWYQGVGQLPFLPLITEESADWYVVNAKNPPYPVSLVGQQLDLLAQWRKANRLPAVPQWCFLEAGFMNKGGGRAPTDEELDAEVEQVLARGVKGVVWFPQRIQGKPTGVSYGFAYDNLTPAEAERLTRLTRRLLGLDAPAVPATLPAKSPELVAAEARIVELTAAIEGAIRALTAATRPAGVGN